LNQWINYYSLSIALTFVIDQIQLTKLNNAGKIEVTSGEPRMAERRIISTHGTWTG